MAKIQEIAELAGVSAATVSRALRDLHHVNEKTKRKVLLAAEELGYEIEHWQSTPGRKHTVGVIAPFISRWYFSQALAGIEQALREAKTDLLLYNFNQIQGRDRIFQERLLRDRVDALIAISLPLTQEELQALVRWEIPTAVIGTRSAHFPSVYIDDVAGAKTATQHLINLGHKDIAIMSGVPIESYDFPVRLDRRDGFMAAMNESGLEFNPMFEVQSDFTQATAVQAMDELLARANRPTALFCESDEMAFGALISARRHGMSVPDDISIVGFDNHEMAAFAGLTTISQPVRMLGEMAAWSIRDKLNNPASEAKSFCLPTNLIVRSTTARIN